MNEKNQEQHGPVTLAELVSAGFNFSGMPVPTTVLVDALADGGIR